MHDLSLVNISTNILIYEDNIRSFLSKLDTEKAFMALTAERVLRSPMVIAVFDEQEIVGLTGLDKRLFFFCTFIILNKRYQGQGLGKKLTIELLKCSQQFSQFIFSVMLVKNVASFRQHIAVGAKMIGVRKNTYYLFFPPPGFVGRALYLIFKISFPIVKLYDLKYFFCRKI